MTSASGKPSIEDLLQHRAWVRRLSKVLVSVPEDASDLEQAAWCQALEAPPRESGNLGSWLAAMMRNLARQWRRSVQTREYHEARSPSAPNTPVADPLDVTARAELHGLLTQEVLAMDSHDRVPLLLRFFDGLSIAEISAQLGLPPETVRTRIRRGVGKLRSRLSKREDLGPGDWIHSGLALTWFRDVPAITAGAVLMTKAGKVTAMLAFGAAVALIAYFVGRDLPVGTEAVPLSTGTEEFISTPPSESANSLRGSDPEIVERTVVVSTETDGRPDPSLAPLLTGHVLDEAGAPVARAQVRWLDPRWGNRDLHQWVSGTKPVLGLTETSDDGAFVIAPVGTAAVFLAIDAAGFIPYRGPRIDLPVCREDLGVIQLQASAVVTGRVTSPQGQGIPGARVRFEPGQRMIARGRALEIEVWQGKADALVATTGEDGEYSLDHLPPTRGALVAEAHGTLQARWPDFLPVRGATTAGVDFVLQSGLTMEGAVLGRDGREVVGARVMISSSPRCFRLGDGAGSYYDRCTMTEEAGRFVVSGLTEGNYWLVADAEGYAPVVQGPFNISTARRQTSVTVELIDGYFAEVQAVHPSEPEQHLVVDSMELLRFDRATGDSNPYVFDPSTRERTTQEAPGLFLIPELPDGRYALKLEIEGCVPTSVRFKIDGADATATLDLEENHCVQGEVITMDGDPVHGAALKRVGLDRRFRSWSTRSDRDGQFSIRAPWVAGDRLVVTHEGRAPSVIEVTEEIAAGKRVTVRVRGGGELIGRVRDRLGNPAPAHRVEVQVAGIPLMAVLSDERGEFRLEGLPPGPYRIESLPASTQGPGLHRLSRVAAPKREDSIVLVTEGAAATVDLTQAQSPTLFGRVESMGEALSDVPIELWLIISSHATEFTISPVASQRTGRDGLYEFHGLSEGTYLVRVYQGNGVVGGETQVRLGHGETKRADFDIRGPPVQGVIHLAGQPLEGATVDLIPVRDRVERAYAESVGFTGDVVAPSMQDRSGSTVSTDSDGRFVVPVVPPGRYVVRVAHASAVTDDSEEFVIEQESSEISIDLTPAATLTVRLNAEGGLPLPNHVVRLSGSDGEVECRTDVHGGARFTSMAAGMYTVEHAASGHRKKLQLEAGERRQLDLTIPHP